MGEPPKRPDWLEAYRQPGHEIKKIKGNYYLYERRTQWDPATKRSKKVSGAYRGRLTPEGIIPPKHPRPQSAQLSETRLRALEFGASRFALQAAGPAEKGGTLYDSLVARACSPQQARLVYLAAILKLCGNSADSFAEAYERSYLSIEYPGVDFSVLSDSAVTVDTAQDVPPKHTASSYLSALVEQSVQELRTLIVQALRSIEELQELGIDRALYYLSGIGRLYYSGAWHTFASSARAAQLCRALAWDFEN